MLNIIVVDARENFLADLKNRIAIRDEINVKIVTTLSSGTDLQTVLKSYQTDAIIVCANAVDTLSDWDFGNIKVVGYEINPNDDKALEDADIPSIGRIKNTTHLLKLLEKPLPDSVKKTPKPDSEDTNVVDDIANNQRQSNESMKPKDVSTDKQVAGSMSSMPGNDEFQAFMAAAYQQWMNTNGGNVSKPSQPIEADDFVDPQKGPQDRIQIPNNAKNNKPEDERNNSSKQVPASSMMRNKLRPDNNRRVTQETEESIEQDLSRNKSKAKVVTVYAAKGGVGKTTISTEIATYLALTGHGRGNYRVCIIDYNIDFGDVRSVLGLDDDAVGMYEWALDIRDRMESGESAESITYGTKSIERFLQMSERTGLYALCAPIKHEESQDILREELDVMIRNIVENGDFDFVICDTGNNTRDSSMFALIYADTVLLVATQDVTTATCNSAVCEALDEFGMDLSKVRLIVNNAMPTKVTGISVQEVEEAFPYQCVAVIRHDTDVIKANNFSKPIVYQANHPVTKEFQKIIAFITGDEGLVADKPKKKGIFSKKKR